MRVIEWLLDPVVHWFTGYILKLSRKQDLEMFSVGQCASLWVPCQHEDHGCYADYLHALRSATGYWECYPWCR